ncbi:MAG TPA: L,D-transpeptidase family protein [Acidimicrobiales bacterium]|nr:L,D-transpeptidase family protein [Acidimicrobiales bacterium]
MAQVPAHNKRRAGGSVRWLVAGIAVVLVAGAAGASFLFGRGGGAATPSAAAASAPAQHARHVALAVVSTSPPDGATDVAPDTALTVTLTTPLATDSPMPSFSPPLAGSWSSLSPTMLRFAADGPIVPGTHETLTVPDGLTGVVSADGQRLTAPVESSFTVAPPSTLRLQQLLAELGYLPLSFTPTVPLTSPAQAADVQPGTFAWRWSTLPATLTSQWTPGSYDVITKAAVMTFQDQHQLGTDGVPGPQVWAALLGAVGAGVGDRAPYDYVVVAKGSPESASVYRDGAVVYSTAVNTGVPAAPTVDGTFPVFEHLVSATMKGTNPDGSKYSDPGVPWVSYFNGGDALHGFVRPGYGYPQSDGCVEMPPSNAAVVFPMTPIGTLVSVVS